eukprot:g3694.t1
MSFQPDAASLQAIIQMLNCSLLADNQVLERVRKEKEGYERNRGPEFALYLNHTFTKCSDAELTNPSVRFTSGVWLKTVVSKCYAAKGMSVAIASVIVDSCTQMLACGNRALQQTSASIISTIVRCHEGALKIWPQLLPTLLSMTQSSTDSSNASLHGSLLCICMLLEDSGDEIVRVHSNGAEALFMRLLDLSQHGDATVRAKSLSGAEKIILYGHELVRKYLQHLLGALSARSSDPSSEVRTIVCNALTLLLPLHMEMLLPSIQPILEFMLAATADAEEGTAMKAAEFWSVFTEECEDATDVIMPYLPRLIPLLISRMTYSEEELADLDVEDTDNAGVADRDQDVRPTFHRGLHENDKDNNDDDGDDDDDDDDDDDVDTSPWSLRRAAATSLDALATTYEDAIIPHLQRPVNERICIQEPERWLEVEAGLLALGCVAHGCVGMARFLPELWPGLVAKTSSTRPLIRKISIWVMQRYAQWAALSAVQGNRAVLQQMLTIVCERMRDHSKIVLEAATAALGSICSTCSEHDVLEPFAMPILQTCMFCFPRFQKRGRAQLLETLDELVAALEGTAVVRSADFVGTLMPPFASAWNAVQSEFEIVNMTGEADLLVTCARVMGPAFGPYASSVFTKSISTWEGMLTILLGADVAGDDEAAQLSEPIIIAVDLIVALVEGLGADFQHLLAQGQTIFDLIVHTCSLMDVDVRVSAFSLVGEMAKNGIGASQLPALAKQVLPKLVASVQYNHNPIVDQWTGYNGAGACCNNALWAIGELLRRMDNVDTILPFVTRLTSNIVEILVDKCNAMPENIRANAAILLGRLLCVAQVPALLEAVSNVFGKWMLLLANLPDDEEKVDAFNGLGVVMRALPQVVVQNFPFLCNALTSWNNAPADLHKRLQAEMLHLQQQMGNEQWEALLHRLRQAPNGEKLMAQMRGVFI